LALSDPASLECPGFAPGYVDAEPTGQAAAEPTRRRERGPELLTGAGDLSYGILLTRRTVSTSIYSGMSQRLICVIRQPGMGESLTRDAVRAEEESCGR
jgi:hypothetical protein